MDSDRSRRFTDREVAMVLRKASEIEEKQGTTVGSGLSLADLEEIAAEVGISGQAITEAVASLDQKGKPGGVLTALPLSNHLVRVVDGELGEEALAGLIRVVDEEVDQAGTVSQALGSVRWTGSDRLRSTVVSVTPKRGETEIQVVEKFSSRFRRILHIMPAAWGVMLTAPLLDVFGLTALGAAGAVVVGAAAGLAAGRAVWGLVSAASRGRVKRLTEALTSEAERLGSAREQEGAPEPEPETIP